MTPEQQVREILILMSPEDSATQTDALYLVQLYMDKMRISLAAKDKQIALLEARLEAKSQEKHDIVNEKLESERRLRKEKDDEVNRVKRERNEEDKGVEAKPGRGRTI